jgi:hypothetical protein
MHETNATIRDRDGFLTRGNVYRETGQIGRYMVERFYVLRGCAGRMYVKMFNGRWVEA